MRVDNNSRPVARFKTPGDAHTTPRILPRVAPGFHAVAPHP